MRINAPLPKEGLLFLYSLSVPIIWGREMISIVRVAGGAQGVTLDQRFATHNMPIRV